MNIQLGMQRISAVWWGLWGLLALTLAIGGVVKGDGSMLFPGLGGVAAAYVAHRVTCWIVAGFFSPRS